MERQWPALPDATPQSLASWAAEITLLLRQGEIASGAAIDALDDLFLTPAEGDAAYVNITGDTMTGTLTVSRTATDSTYIRAQATEDGAVSGPMFTTDRISASPAPNDLIGKYLFRGRDSAGNETDYAYLQGRIDDPTNGSEDSSVLLGRMAGGAAVEEVIQTAGKQSLWQPSFILATFAASSPPLAERIIGAGGIGVFVFSFDATTAENLYFDIAMPKSWDNGNISFQVHWTHGATVTNFGVVWRLVIASLSNDDSLDSAFGYDQSVADTGGTTNDLYISPESTAATPTGAANSDNLSCRLSRVPTDASDTLAIDARVLGVMIFYNTNAATDA